MNEWMNTAGRQVSRQAGKEKTRYLREEKKKREENGLYICCCCCWLKPQPNFCLPACLPATRVNTSSYMYIIANHDLANMNEGREEKGRETFLSPPKTTTTDAKCCLDLGRRWIAGRNWIRGKRAKELLRPQIQLDFVFWYKLLKISSFPRDQYRGLETMSAWGTWLLASRSHKTLTFKPSESSRKNLS